MKKNAKRQSCRQNKKSKPNVRLKHWRYAEKQKPKRQNAKLQSLHAGMKKNAKRQSCRQNKGSGKRNAVKQPNPSRNAANAVPHRRIIWQLPKTVLNAADTVRYSKTMWKLPKPKQNLRADSRKNAKRQSCWQNKGQKPNVRLKHWLRAEKQKPKRQNAKLPNLHIARKQNAKRQNCRQTKKPQLKPKHWRHANKKPLRVNRKKHEKLQS